MRIEVFINAMKVLLELPGQDVDLLYAGLREADFKSGCFYDGTITPKEAAEILVTLWRKGN